MGRKVAFTTTAVLVVVLSVVLVGGQVGRGRFFELGNHEPIYIFGDDQFTRENGVVSGCGTALNPYVIEGWHIDAPAADYGVYIDHTTACFVIRDCTVERARLAGVYFNTVRNGLVEASRIRLSDTAVYLLNSSGNRLRGNVIADCLNGVVMGARAVGNVVAWNAFLDNGMSGYDPYRANQWHEDCRGNFWSDYDGVDRNCDGIGDVPYFRVFDPGPLMSPPGNSCVAPSPPVEVEVPLVVVMPQTESAPASVQSESMTVDTAAEAAVESEPEAEPSPESAPPMVDEEHSDEAAAADEGAVEHDGESDVDYDGTEHGDAADDTDKEDAEADSDAEGAPVEDENEAASGTADPEPETESDPS